MAIFEERIGIPLARGMKILIVGFYGVMNAGDDLLQQALAWLFREHQLTFSCVLPKQDSIQQFDLLVVGGGSLWPQHPFFQCADDYAKSLRIPYMVLGISARSFDTNVARKTRLLVERSLLFTARDTETAQWLDHPRITVGPDLFWTAPWSGDSEVSQFPDEGLALAPRSTALAEWPVSDLVGALLPLGPIRGWPFFYGDARHDRGGCNDFESLHSEMADVPQSFSLQPLRRSRLVFSMRYHGLLCALRAGRPVLVGNVHAKLGSFCHDHGLSSWNVADVSALSNQAREMAANFDHERQRALALRERLLTEGQTLASLIRRRVAEIPARPLSRARGFLVNGMRNVLGRIS